MDESAHVPTWTDIWVQCTQMLGSADEVRHIVEQASGRVGASWLITMTTPAPPGAIDTVTRMIERRRAGEPLQYVLGRWGFRQLNLRVDKRVLIPRPETEQVVEAALRTMCACPTPIIVDLGTGSGAIALSIALESPTSEVWAVDQSEEALEVAESNLADLPAQVQERVVFRHGSWFHSLPPELKGRVDMIVSNPPYVADCERGELDPQVREWEPALALFAGAEGLDAIEVILCEASEWLCAHGALVVEFAPSQAEQVELMAWQAGFFSVEIGRDLAQRQRWLVATKAS